MHHLRHQRVLRPSGFLKSAVRREILIDQAYNSIVPPQARKQIAFAAELSYSGVRTGAIHIPCLTALGKSVSRLNLQEPGFARKCNSLPNLSRSDFRSLSPLTRPAV